MAKADFLSREELATTLVQEMSKKGQVPDDFLQKDCIQPAIDDPDVMKNTLLIDFSRLSSPSMSIAGAELEKFRSALSEWGCVLIINHGMENSFLEELIEVAKQFFDLPLEEKEKCAGSSGNILQGYACDNSYDDLSGKIAWSDRLFLDLYPEDLRDLRFWPQKPEKIRPMLEEFTKNLIKMNEAIYKAMARSLNLEEDCFLNRMGKRGSILGKFTLYPRCPCPEKVQGAHRHTDATTMTIILPQNDVDGLQIEKDDQWYQVPVIPGALTLTLGDLGEVMSNGVFKVCVHRVATNSVKDRVSLVALSRPENVNAIEPVKEFVSANPPQKFRSFSIDEYMGLYFKSYVRGQSALDAFKLV